MIWIWLGQFFAYLGWLFIPPPADTKIPRVLDENAPCIYCGHCEGKLSAAINGDKPGCQHTCKICGGMWIEPTSLADFVPPIIAAQVATVPTPVEPEKAR